MKTYQVTIREVLEYEILVDAHDEEEAKEMAFESPLFCNNISTRNDAEVTDVEVYDENPDCEE